MLDPTPINGVWVSDGGGDIELSDLGRDKEALSLGVLSLFIEQ